MAPTARARDGVRVFTDSEQPQSTVHTREGMGKVDIFDFVLEAHRPPARGMGV